MAFCTVSSRVLSITGAVARESSAFTDITSLDCGTPFGGAAHLGHIEGTSVPRRISWHMSRYRSRLTPVPQRRWTHCSHESHSRPCSRADMALYNTLQWLSFNAISMLLTCARAFTRILYMYIRRLSARGMPLGDSTRSKQHNAAREECHYWPHDEDALSATISDHQFAISPLWTWSWNCSRIPLFADHADRLLCVQISAFLLFIWIYVRPFSFTLTLSDHKWADFNHHVA